MLPHVSCKGQPASLRKGSCRASGVRTRPGRQAMSTESTWATSVSMRAARYCWVGQVALGQLSGCPKGDARTGLCSVLLSPSRTPSPLQLAIGSSASTCVHCTVRVRTCILLEGKSSPPLAPSAVQPVKPFHVQAGKPARGSPLWPLGTEKGFSALTYEASFVTLPASRLPSVQATAVQALPCR